MVGTKVASKRVSSAKGCIQIDFIFKINLASPLRRIWAILRNIIHSLGYSVAYGLVNFRNVQNNLLSMALVSYQLQISPVIIQPYKTAFKMMYIG